MTSIGYDIIETVGTEDYYYIISKINSYNEFEKAKNITRHIRLTETNYLGIKSYLKQTKN